MSRGKCSPRIKIDGGYEYSWSISYLCHIQQLVFFISTAEFVIRYSLRNPLVSFWHKLAYLCSWLPRGNIWKEAFHLFKVIFLFGLATWPPTWRSFLLLLQAFSFLRWPLGWKRKPSILTVELSYPKVPFHSCKLVGLTGIVSVLFHLLTIPSLSQRYSWLEPKRYPSIRYHQSVCEIYIL